MHKFTTVAALVAVFALSAFRVYAAGADSTQKNGVPQASIQTHQGQGVVNKISLEDGKVNISHEDIKSLKWPKMTMDFNVQDRAGLAQVKPGMKVDFELARFPDGYRITRIVPAKQ